MGWGALRRGVVGAACATIACVVALVIPSSAVAVFNPLSGSDGCLYAPYWFDHSVPDGCGLFAAPSIGYLEDIAIDPTGSDLYAPDDDGTLWRFSRDPATGVISETGDCWNLGDGSDGCTPSLGMGYATAVEISSDGRFVYVGGYDRTIARFQRDPATGALTQSAPPDACWGGIASGCTVVRGISDRYMYDLELTADGTGLLVSNAYGPLTSLQRDVMTGTLTQPADARVCWGDDDTDDDGQPCRSHASYPWTNRSSATTPDGRFIYDATDDTLMGYARDPATGLLAPILCAGYWDWDPAECADHTAYGMSGARAVALSSDGAYLYVTGWNSISAYAVDGATGALTPLGGNAACLWAGTVVPATCRPLRGYDDGNDIVISPDGATVYVSGGDALLILDRNAATGELTQRAGRAGCITSGTTAAPSCDVAGSDIAWWHMVMSPDGANLYALGDNGILTFGNPAASCRDITAAAAVNDAQRTIRVGCVGLDPDLKSYEIVSPPTHGTIGAIDQVDGTIQYTPDGSWIGTDTFTYRATDGFATTAAATVTLTSRARTLPVEVSPATISGIERVGEVLTVTDGTWTSPVTPIYKYRAWSICDATLTTCTAMTQTRIPASALNMRIRVETSARNPDGLTQGTSIASGVIGQSTGPKLTGSSLYGSALVGSILRDDSTWFSTNGLTYARTWERCDLTLTTCTATTTTTQTYSVTAADLGSRLRVSVTVTDPYGSATNTLVSGEVLAAPPAPTYVYLDWPAVTGTALVGNTLTAVPGVLHNATETSHDYQWRRCDDSGYPCEDIPGATSTSYVLTAADHGYALEFFQRSYFGANLFRWRESAATAEIRDPAEVGTMAPVSTTAPVISGTIAVNRYAYADRGTWDGVDPITYAWQWLRCDAAGANCVPESSGSSSAYYVAFADAGSTIRVSVTATNSDGSATATSAAVAIPHPPPMNSSYPTLSTANPIEGVGVSASNGTWTTTTPITSWRYEFWRCPSAPAGAPGAACTQIGNGPSNVVLPTAAEVDSNIGVRVFATNSAGEAGGYWQWSGTVRPAAPTLLAPGSVSGTAAQAQTLSYAAATWSASRPLTRSHIWQRCLGDGTGCVNIVGSTDALTHVVDAADEDRTLRVVESAWATGEVVGPTATDASPPSATVPLEPPHAGTTPFIGSTSAYGVPISTWLGAATFTSPAAMTMSRQWLRCDASGGSCTPIAGATATSYTPVAGDIGGTLRVDHTATNTAGSTTVQTPASGIVQPPPPQVNLSARPLVSGIRREGELLSATTGGFITAGPVTYAYQWQRCNSLATACTDIAGATASSWNVVVSDIATWLRVRVTASNSTGSASMTSDLSGVTMPVQPVVATLPTVVGTGQVGSTMTFTHPGWTSSVPVTESFLWERCNADGTGCSGYSSWSETLTVDDGLLGFRVRVVVYGNNGGGPNVVATSALGPVVTGPPRFTSLALLSGGEAIGSVLTASSTYVGTAPLSIEFEWQRCASIGGGCVTIADERGATHTVSSADRGRYLRAIVIVSNALGTRSATTNSIQVDQVPPKLLGAGTLSGPLIVGRRLTYRRGTWDGGDWVNVNWQRCSSAGIDCTYVASTNDLEYTLTRADDGHWIRVTESASNAAGRTDSTTAFVGPVVFDDTVLPTAVVSLPSITTSGRVSARLTPVAGLGSAAAWELLEQRSTVFAGVPTTRTTRSTSFAIAPGETLCVRARSITELGLGAWGARACTSRAVAGNSLRAVGSWTRTRTTRTSRTRGASLELRAGRPIERISLIAYRCPTCGSILVEAGGRTIWRRSLTGSSRMTTYVLPRLATNVRGTVRIRVTSSRRRVTIGGLAALVAMP